ncbi:MAG TPA: DUF4232 domain-containing protein [Acidimicrobiia bacterium]|nr:DUF4232 domain-containing protein [Acidimicrobiia bacterium]
MTATRLSLIALAVLLGVAGQAAATTGPRATVHPCRTSQLHISFARLDAGAGQRYVPLVLTNASRVRCSVGGRPTLQLVAADGTSIPTTVTPSGVGSVRPLTVAAGRRVSFLLHWIGIPLSDESQTGTCEATPARVRITLPGAATTQSVGWPFGPVCGHGAIDVSPARPGVPSG